MENKELLEKLIRAEAEIDDVVVAVTGTPLGKDLDAILTTLSNLITKLQRGGY